jgi:hypothetical protein
MRGEISNTVDGVRHDDDVEARLLSRSVPATYVNYAALKARAEVVLNRRFIEHVSVETVLDEHKVAASLRFPLPPDPTA